MHPLVRGAAASALLLALGALDEPTPPPQPTVVPPAAAGRPSPGARPGLVALCGPRTVPEGEACVPLPARGAVLSEGGAVATGAHRGAGAGRPLEAYDHIPRRPDRPATPTAYVYPLGAPDKTPSILSGYDLDRPDREQRDALDPEHAKGHGGLDLAAERGDPVALVALEAQEGPAEVVFVGELFGITVATAHLVREATRLRPYVVLHGHLDRPGPGVVPGARLAAGDTVGFAGDSGSPGIVHLHLEVRQVREGVALAQLDPKRLVDNATSIPCDPRNVLPLKEAAPAPATPAPAPAPAP